MNDKTYFLPETIDEALTLANSHRESFAYIAGGSDVQLHFKQRLINPEAVIDISRIHRLRRADTEREDIRLGSMMTLDRIIHDPAIREKYPMVCESAQTIATPVIRKTATIGGNLMVSNRCSFYNQSYDWRQAVGFCLKNSGDVCQVTGGLHRCYSRNVSDLAPALIALNARIAVQSVSGRKEIPLIDLYIPDGLIVHESLGVGGLITEIIIPNKPAMWWFKKLRLRKSLDFTSLTVAATVNKNDALRVCVNGVSMAPVLIETASEDITLDYLIRQIKRACKTVDNDYLPLKYRREMIDVFLTECWNAFFR